MHHIRRNYLRRERRSWALRQKDLAALLGVKSTTHVSRLERSKSLPSIRTAIALEVILGLPPERFLPGLYDLVEEDVMARAAKMHERLADRVDIRAVRRRKLCEEMLARSSARAATRES